jgi:5-methylcytosine-specific restriction endonuclease McrA
MNKKIRQQVYTKYNGHCAYCGCEITMKQLQVDHIQAHWHTVPDIKANQYGITKGTHDIENLNPSCARCNRWKGTFSIEQFRTEITLQIERLNKWNANYRLAKDYGMILETTPIKVTFYFEQH